MTAFPADAGGARQDALPAAVAETHVAVLFFVGDRAYKLKKPVDLGFLDFTSPQARRQACERELRLNRRFAPDVYLGLAELRLPGQQEPEPLVVMRRMPADRRLSELVRRGLPVDDILARVARLLAARHARERRRPEVDAQGTRDAVRARWEASFAQVRALVGPVPGEPERTADRVQDAAAGAVPHGAPGPAPGLDELEGLVRRYLSGRERLFDSRIKEGRIVDGHGDLLAEDIFCLPDGPRLLDCLEFDDRLRYLDGLDDAAFLAMDLERLGAPQAGARFLARYADYSGDPAPPSLLHHYVAYRAFVRAKVAFIRAAQGGKDSRAAAGARQLTAIALRHLRSSAVTAVLVGGVPGSGKSTLSGALADRLGMTLLSSDRIRKELAGIPAEQSATAPFGTGLYTPQWTARTYAALLDRAAALLSSGESVVLDATWTAESHRQAAAQVAARTGARLVALRCEAPQEVAAARVATRSRGASDADAAVAAALAGHQQPWPDAVTIDTGGPPAAAVERAAAAVRPGGTEHAPVFRRPYMEPD